MGNFNSSSKIPPQEPTQVNSLKFSKPVIISLVIISILITSYFALAKYQSWWPFDISTTQPSPLTTTSSNVAADWKTYTDPQNGYSFKSPADWTVSAHGNILFIRSPRANNETYPYSILISAYSSSYTTAGQAFEFLVLPHLRKDIDHQVKDINFNGYSAVYFYDLGMSESNNIVVVPNNIVHLVPQEGGTVEINYSSEYDS